MTSTRHVTPVGRDRRMERASWVPTFGPGMLLGAISTVGLVVAMFMSWRTPDVHPSGVPFAFLFDDGTTAHDPSILLALIPFAVVLGIGTLMPGASAARVVGALGAIAVVTLFAIQSNQLLDRLPNTDLGDVLDTGFYVAAIAGLIGLVSGFLPAGWAERRRIETESSVVGPDLYDESRV